jgi:hypothetical protein
MLDFQQNYCQVVYKQKSLDHAVCVADNLEVIDPPLLLVKYPDTIEQPKGEDENKEKDGKGSSEQMDSGG